MVFDEPISFERWISFVFDRPATGRPWYWDIHDDPCDGQSADIVALLTRTFEECDTALSSFSDEQVAQGLEFLICPTASNYAYALREASVPISNRLHCIDTMAILFERCFAQRCAPHLSHLEVERAREKGKPLERTLNHVCYRWWDHLPIHGLVFHQPGNPDAEELDRAVLAVQQRILAIDHVACQESALFGLADSAIYYSESDEVIDDFISNHRDLWKQFKRELRERFLGRTGDQLS